VSDRQDLLGLVRAARVRIESERLAGLSDLALRIPPFRPASARTQAEAPTPASDAAPPAWPHAGVRPSQDPSKMPDPLPPAAQSKFEALKAVEAELGDCTRCRLGHGRTCLVYGVGNPDADLMFVGEGPGSDEDRLGEPFVGKAGQLLTRIIEHVLKLTRQDVYIANIVKCRPPNNRNPQPDEVEACSPFLARQIEVIQPRVIVALGGPATKFLLETDVGITRLRGQFVQKHGAQIMPTFHPAYLLRLPPDREREEKRKVWDDMVQVARMLAGPEPT